MEPQFQKDFLFGAVSSAFQNEGGWDLDGKGASIWDDFTHQAGRVRDGARADTASNTYGDPDRDIDLMADLNLNAYRFSISWPRVVPLGRGDVNQKGLDYYDRLADKLLAKNIRPFATLFHWDTPLTLYRENGGFESRETASYFADYARAMVARLGDRIKDWITLNEPWEHAMFGHFLGEHAPGKVNPWSYFKVAHHQLLGHGLAVQALRGERQDLNVGLTLSQFPVYPGNFEPTASERDSVEIADQFINRFFLDGVFRGSYPSTLLSRLWPIAPKVRAGDMATIAQPVDFLGVNYYTRLYASRRWYIPFLGTWIDRTPKDPRYADPILGPGAYPDGLKELGRRYREDYGNPVVYITENGTSVPGTPEEKGTLDDGHRIRYISAYLKALKETIDEGSDIRGYFYWSLTDNFEWLMGYSHPMGLVKVDPQTQRREVRSSGLWYRDFIVGQGATGS